MKKSELQQIIKEEIENVLINEAFVNPQGELEDFKGGGLVSALINTYKNKGGKPGLIISKFNILEKVLKQLKKISKSDEEIKIIDFVLDKLREIREI
jgi:hypothetical protein